ncbi:MAG: hypothetical protein VKJ24_08915, partial [Synechococcales bacterium]|nr:hypothetical protein [Synechococcales bacterium]
NDLFSESAPMDLLITRTISPISPIARWVTHYTSLALAVALGGGIVAPAIAEVTPTADVIPATPVERPAPTSQNSATTAPTLPDGTYLYGESEQPNQIGRAYFVFEVQQGKVLGALYMPSSSFDCTYGNFQADRMALKVINSYERTIYPYEIGLTRSSQVASTGSSALPLGLEGFKPISQVSDNDRRMLSMCKTAIAHQLTKPSAQ